MQNSAASRSFPCLPAVPALPALPALLALLSLLSLTLTFSSPAARAQIVPQVLRCEYRTNPSGIAETRPRLYWQVRAARANDRGKRQSAYRIQAASSRQKLEGAEPDLWDTGKLLSPETTHIRYGGKRLRSGQMVWWRVQTWDEQGKPSSWSRPAFWTMGLLEPGDWKGKWITYPRPEEDDPGLANAQWVWHAADGAVPPVGKRFFRTGISLPADAKIKKALLAISADDRYTFTLNRLRQAGPAGGETWQQYQVYSVASALQPGQNALFIEAENLTAGPAGVIARLTVETDRGTLAFVSDGLWESSTEPLTGFAPVGGKGGYGAQPWGAIGSKTRNLLYPPPYFRREFTVTRPVRRAVLYATALGVYEISLNGRRIGDDVLSPGWTEYRRRVHYLAYDVTDRVKSGGNTLGAILGDGWYASYTAFTGRRRFYGGTPGLLLQLQIEYQEGASEVIATGEDWKTATGPLLSADLLMGTATDTRREMPGWDTAGFNDSGWKPAVTLPSPAIVIEPQENEPIRPTARIRPVSRTNPAPGVYIYNLGQNITGWARLTVTGKPGQELRVRHGERLNPDGTLYTTNLRSAKATDTYILRGGRQTLEPKFTFHGFQYVEVTGLEKAPAPGEVEAIVVHSDLARTLRFDSDNPLLNRLVENIDWGLRGNYLDVPTDCPQRDERLGWTGDAQVFARTAMYQRFSAPFFTKWLVDLCQDSQNPDGSYGDVAPTIGGGGNAGWEDAAVICVFRMYEMYGDTAVIRRHWDSLTRFMAHLKAVAPLGIRQAGMFGDWLLLDGLQYSPIYGTAYYYYCADLMRQMAAVIGRNEEAEQYRAVAGQVREAFLKTFVREEGRLADPAFPERATQSFYTLALASGVLPENLRPAAARQLTGLIAARGNQLTTGMLGTPALLPALTGSGHSDLAGKLLLAETYPSWLYLVKLGATTLWERWDGWTEAKGFQDPIMNSFNHYWPGCVGEWIYGTLGGIGTDGPGFQRSIIRPYIAAGLNRVAVTYEALTGTIESRWNRSSEGLTLAVTVPANTTATIYLPATLNDTVTESGKPLDTARPIYTLRRETDSLVLEVGSGKYYFRVTESVSPDKSGKSGK